MAKILIIGCGDIGGELATRLAISGHDVTGLKRKPPLKASSIKYLKADVTDYQQLDSITLYFDQVVYILSPSSRKIDAYKAVFETGVTHVLTAFKMKCPNVAFTFVSSSRVYGQHKGEWLNEDSRTGPTDERGKILLAAENDFLSFNEKTTVMRFSGIYGRSQYLINKLKSGESVQKEPPYYTNRIHRDDCIASLAFLINKKANGEKLKRLYLGTDSDPATTWDVANYITQKLGIPQPSPRSQEINADSNKRLENKRLIAEGFVFKFKSYKEGYCGVIDEQL